MVSESFIRKNPKTGKWINFLFTVISTMLVTLWVASITFGWTTKANMRTDIDLKASRLELKDVETKVTKDIEGVEANAYKYTNDQLNIHRGEDETRYTAIQQQFEDVKALQTVQYQDLKGDLKLIIELNN